MLRRDKRGLGDINGREYHNIQLIHTRNYINPMGDKTSDLDQTNPGAPAQENKPVTTQPVIPTSTTAKHPDTVKLRNVEENNKKLTQNLESLSHSYESVKNRYNDLLDLLHAAESRIGARGIAITDNRLLHERLTKEFKEKYKTNDRL